MLLNILELTGVKLLGKDDCGSEDENRKECCNKGNPHGVVVYISVSVYRPRE